MKRSEHAVEQFKSGLNCSQSVFGEFAEDLGVDLDTACQIACGFGGGMGRTGGVCGAVTGAIMAIGLANCGPDPRDRASKLHVYNLVRSFIEQFEAHHETTLCRDLLGCDISTVDGYAEADNLGLFRTHCPRYVESAVEILENILEEK